MQNAQLNAHLVKLCNKNHSKNIHAWTPYRELSSPTWGCRVTAHIPAHVLPLVRPPIVALVLIEARPALKSLLLLLVIRLPVVTLLTCLLLIVVRSVAKVISVGRPTIAPSLRWPKVIPLWRPKVIPLWRASKSAG